MDASDSFGYWVRRFRKALDLTQEDLARQVGCAVVTLRKIEADERRPSRQMAERLAHCLGLSPEETGEFLTASFGEWSTVRLSRAKRNNVAYPANNLPAAMGPLIGRSAELEVVVSCMRRKDIRLHTLTGPVGVGKTRLAIEAGRSLQRDFLDGVFLISLETVQDPALIPSITAAVLGVREAPGQSLQKSLTDYLASREILLIYDNFEHLQPAAEFLAELMRCAPGLRLLVTSRAILHLYGENEYVVPPLPVPNPSDLAEAAESATVHLFCERARAVRADFRLTPDLIPTVVEICRRLDGLPLAIELAAARIKLFSPKELLQRLENRLPTLTQSSTDLSPRVQGLETAIAWSYDLLPPPERTLLNRLAVFTGSFSLVAAQNICAFPYNIQSPSTSIEPTLELPEITDSLTALLNQSLLQRQKTTHATAESRFIMLETIREFAMQQLRASHEVETMQQRHAVYFTDWAENAESHLYGPDQAAWLTSMELDTNNLRSALSWWLNHAQVEAAARLVCALENFWQRRGLYSEGRAWAEKVLALIIPGTFPARLHAKTLLVAGSLAYRQGDWTSAHLWLEASLTLFQSQQDSSGIARALVELGWIAIDQGEYCKAARLNQTSLELAKKIGDRPGIYQALTNLGWMKLSTGEHTQAVGLFDEAHKLAQEIQHIRGIVVSQINLTWIALEQNDLTQAVAQAKASLRLSYSLKEWDVVAECLEAMVVVTTIAGEYERAARMSGAAQVFWDALPAIRSLANYSGSKRVQAVAALQHNLTMHTFLSFWEQGRNLDLDSLVAFALGDEVE